MGEVTTDWAEKSSFNSLQTFTSKQCTVLFMVSLNTSYVSDSVVQKVHMMQQLDYIRWFYFDEREERSRNDGKLVPYISPYTLSHLYNSLKGFQTV